MSEKNQQIFNEIGRKMKDKSSEENRQNNSEVLLSPSEKSLHGDSTSFKRRNRAGIRGWRPDQLEPHGPENVIRENLFADTQQKFQEK